MKISLLINMKMPTVVGIFMFISRENFMYSWLEHEKKFYNLGARILPVCILESQGCKVSSCGKRRLIKHHGRAGWSASSFGEHVGSYVFSHWCSRYSLSAERITEYECMNAERRPGWNFVQAQADLNLRILSMFEGPLSHVAAQH